MTKKYHFHWTLFDRSSLQNEMRPNQNKRCLPKEEIIVEQNWILLMVVGAASNHLSSDFRQSRRQKNFSFETAEHIHIYKEEKVEQ